MVLSERLQLSAAFITKGNVVADIGCDHAHIPIMLVKNGICPRVIAMDVRTGPLQRAEENIRRYACESRIETRLSDGLAELRPGEADTLLIAGMGGGLTVRILSSGIDCVRSAREIILQPQSERGAVRRFLYENGFVIQDEAMCREDGKYYNAIRAVTALCTAGKTQEVPEECDFEYGKKLLDGQHPLLYDYLTEEYRKGQLVREKLIENDTVNTRERLPGLLHELEVLEQALQRYVKR